MKDELKAIEGSLGCLSDGLADCKGTLKAFKALNPRIVEGRSVTAKLLDTTTTALVADAQKLAGLTSELVRHVNASPSQQPSTTATVATAASKSKET